MDILFRGLNCNILFTKSNSILSSEWRLSCLPFSLSPLRFSSIDSPASDPKASISLFFGIPVHATTLSSWSMVETPGKSGLPLTISAIRQPKLQISTPLVQHCDLIRISGALYHLVATYSVITIASSSSFLSRDLTSPKSQSLTLHSTSMRMLEGLMSLCSSSAEWRYLSAFAIWQMMNCCWCFLRMSCLTKWQRSMSMCSKIKYMS